MSGDRQHFLPRFLQRGFTTHPGSERTWLYRKGQEPREVGIGDIGMERQFYTESGDSSVDHAITEAEATEFSSIVARARESIGDFVDSGIPRLIAHFEVRSRNLREGAVEVLERMWAGISYKIQEPGVLEAMLARRLELQRSRTLADIKKELRSKGLPESKAPQMLRHLKRALPIVARSPEVTQMAALLRILLPATFKEGAKLGQINALRRSIAPEIRVEVYRRLKFTVEEVTDANMILGDSAVIFLVETNTYKPFLDKNDVVQALFLPVSSSRVVVGSRERFTFSSNELQHHVARCSYDFFVAAANSDTNRQLMAAIRSEALPLSDEAIDELVTKIVDSQLN